MALTTRQRMLLHLIVRRFDREANATYLDPVILEDELAASLPELAEDIDVLEAQGYVERGHMATTAEDEAAAVGGEDSWVLIPTDSGILTAMGLG
jgi:hypothetical protein